MLWHFCSEGPFWHLSLSSLSDTTSSLSPALPDATGSSHSILLHLWKCQSWPCPVWGLACHSPSKTPSSPGMALNTPDCGGWKGRRKPMQKNPGCSSVSYRKPPLHSAWSKPKNPRNISKGTVSTVNCGIIRLVLCAWLPLRRQSKCLLKLVMSQWRSGAIGLFGKEMSF